MKTAILFTLLLISGTLFSQPQPYGEAPLQDVVILFYADSAAVTIFPDEEFLSLESQYAKNNRIVKESVSASDEPEKIVVTFGTRNLVFINTTEGTTSLLYTCKKGDTTGVLTINGKRAATYDLITKKFEIIKS